MKIFAKLVMNFLVFFLVYIRSLPCTSRRTKDCEKLCESKNEKYLYCKMNWIGKVTCQCEKNKYML